MNINTDPPGKTVSQHTTEHEANRRRHAGSRGIIGKGSRPFRSRFKVRLEEGQCRRSQNGRADALGATCHDQLWRILRNSDRKRGEGKHRQADDQYPTAAENVAAASGQQQESTEG
jgi:hypothetical protein